MLIIISMILVDSSSKSIASDSLTPVLNTFMYRQVLIAPVSLHWFRMQGHALVKIQAMEEPIRDNISVTCVVQSRNAKPTWTHCDSQRIHYKRRLLYSVGYLVFTSILSVWFGSETLWEQILVVKYCLWAEMEYLITTRPWYGFNKAFTLQFIAQLVA